MRTFLTRLLLCFAVPVSATAGQQAIGPVRRPVPVIDAKVRNEVVDKIATEFARLYVDADTGRMIADHLRQRARAHAYDQLSDPRLFAEAMSTDLQAINGDKHLFVNFAPGVEFDRPGPGGIVPDTGRVQRTRPGADEGARRNHWSLGRVDILPGNVGYFKVTGFEGSKTALDATSAALAYLEGTDAMIFDMRGMGGGSGEQSNFLISHFTGPDTVPSLVVTNRSSGRRRVRYTLATVPGKRRPQVPIWILTDRGTASAGEDFAFVLQQLGRARTVGDRSAGAGHNNDIVDAGHGFGVSISFTRVADPRSGKEWERIGVIPDMSVNPASALTAAHAAALDSLATLAKDPVWARTLRVTQMGVTAQANPPAISAETLSGYAGTYEGGRVISLDRGALSFRRFASRPPRILTAVNDSTFVLNELEITFRRASGGAIQMVQHLPDGSVFVLRREGDVPGELAP
jgi:hypothetical protein